MKITYNGLVNSVTGSIQTNLKKMLELQERLSSGKTINKPSDNPVSTAQLNILKSRKIQHEQYLKNINNSIGWLESTENHLTEISNSLVTLREISIQAGNGALNQEGRNTLLLQVTQIKNKLLNDLNAQHLGNYLFAGLKTTSKPFEEHPVLGVVYLGDNNVMNRGISFESEIGINIDGERIFNFNNSVSADQNVFEIIENLEQALAAGDTLTISSDIIAQLDRASTNILNLISEVGSKVQRLELTKHQHENDILNYTKNISVKEDIDIPEAIMNLKQAETAYRTSLAVAGRIFPPSLLDFLK